MLSVSLHRSLPNTNMLDLTYSQMLAHKARRYGLKIVLQYILAISDIPICHDFLDISSKVPQKCQAWATESNITNLTKYPDIDTVGMIIGTITKYQYNEYQYVSCSPICKQHVRNKNLMSNKASTSATAAISHHI